MKDQVINILAIGILALLGFIVVGDFFISLQENRPVDDSVVNLLQLTGMVLPSRKSSRSMNSSMRKKRWKVSCLQLQA